MKALISDIHSNLEALNAVLADIAAHDVEAIYCLGDVVGYGPNPRECLELVMQRCQVCVLGNHDQAALWDPREFNPTAEKAAFWTRKQLDAPIRNREAAELRWEYLAERPLKHKDKDFLLVHGSPRNPLNEYIFPEDIYNQRKMNTLFGLVERCCFHSHTHNPGIFTDKMEFYAPEDVDYRYKLEARKTLPQRVKSRVVASESQRSPQVPTLTPAGRVTGAGTPLPTAYSSMPLKPNWPGFEVT